MIWFPGIKTTPYSERSLCICLIGTSRPAAWSFYVVPLNSGLVSVVFHLQGIFPFPVRKGNKQWGQSFRLDRVSILFSDFCWKFKLCLLDTSWSCSWTIRSPLGCRTTSRLDEVRGRKSASSDPVYLALKHSPQMTRFSQVWGSNRVVLFFF